MKKEIVEKKDVTVPRRWMRPIIMSLVLCLLLVVSLGSGAAYLAARVSFFALQGGAAVLVGLASLGASTIHSLESGNSQERLAVLTTIKAHQSDRNAGQMDAATWEAFRPAVQACRQDADPAVVALAEEIIAAEERFGAQD